MSFPELVERLSSMHFSHATANPAEIEKYNQEYMILLRKVIDASKTYKPFKHMFFATINFKPDIGIDTVLSAAYKVSSRSFVKKYAYSIEQRGESEETMGNGIHIHFLFTTDTNRSHVVKYLYSSLKEYVGNPRHVDVREYPLSYWDDKISYIKGDKWDDEKTLKVETDRLFRKKNNIEQYYTSNASSQTSLTPSTSSS